MSQFDCYCSSLIHPGLIVKFRRKGISRYKCGWHEPFIFYPDPLQYRFPVGTSFRRRKVDVVHQGQGAITTTVPASFEIKVLRAIHVSGGYTTAATRDRWDGSGERLDFEESTCQEESIDDCDSNTTASWFYHFKSNQDNKKEVGEFRYNWSGHNWASYAWAFDGLHYSSHEDYYYDCEVSTTGDNSRLLGGFDGYGLEEGAITHNLNVEESQAVLVQTATGKHGGYPESVPANDLDEDSLPAPFFPAGANLTFTRKSTFSGPYLTKDFLADILEDMADMEWTEGPLVSGARIKNLSEDELTANIVLTEFCVQADLSPTCRSKIKIVFAFYPTPEIFTGPIEPAKFRTFEFDWSDPAGPRGTCIPETYDRSAIATYPVVLDWTPVPNYGDGEEEPASIDEETDGTWGLYRAEIEPVRQSRGGGGGGEGEEEEGE